MTTAIALSWAGVRVLREGGDVTLMGIGVMVHACLEAADLLAQEGIDARVLNLACLKPLDWELVVDCARRDRGRGHRRGTHGRTAAWAAP